MQLGYYSLAIEVTRRCNQQCTNYCMRGPRQNLDIDLSYIQRFLDNDFLRVGTLVFSGGEPTLNPTAVTYAIDYIIQKRIPIQSVSMVTNGLNFSKEVVEAFERFYTYCYDEFVYLREFANYFSNITFSNDQYHLPISDDVLEKYYDYGPHIFFSFQGIRDNDILKSGFSETGKELDTNQKNLRIFGNIVLDLIYLTAKGNYSVLGDGSYDLLDHYSSDDSVFSQPLDEFCFDHLSASSRPSKAIKKYLKNR